MVTLKNVSPINTNELFSLSEKLEIDYSCYEGCLIDNFIFYDAFKIAIKRKSFDYIILKETYVNEWTSNYTIIMTNDFNVVREYESMFEKLNEDEKESV